MSVHSDARPWEHPDEFMDILYESQGGKENINFGNNALVLKTIFCKR